MVTSRTASRLQRSEKQRQFGYNTLPIYLSKARRNMNIKIWWHHSALASDKVGISPKCRHVCIFIHLIYNLIAQPNHTNPTLSLCVCCSCPRKKWKDLYLDLHLMKVDAPVWSQQPDPWLGYPHNNNLACEPYSSPSYPQVKFFFWTRAWSWSGKLALLAFWQPFTLEFSYCSAPFWQRIACWIFALHHAGSPQTSPQALHTQPPVPSASPSLQPEAVILFKVLFFSQTSDACEVHEPVIAVLKQVEHSKKVAPTHRAAVTIYV